MLFRSLAIALIGGYEGLRLNSYQDVIGVWTACYGETRGIKKGMSFTKAECDAQFSEGLIQFEAGMRKCLAKPDDIPIKPYIAFLSLSYNVGIGAFCKSSVAAFANVGAYKAACNRIPAFNKAINALARSEGADILYDGENRGGSSLEGRRAEIEKIIGWMKLDPKIRRLKANLGREKAIRYAIGHIIDNPPAHVEASGG